MTLGVVAWPDEALSTAVRRVWDAIAAVGCPSLSGTVQIPHVSFVVADSLDDSAVASACGRVPSVSLSIAVSGVGVFPGGVVYLSIRPTDALLTEHRRIHRATRGLLADEWPYYATDEWTPHVTLAAGLDESQVALAMRVALPLLPQSGRLESGGIENGLTGERTVLSG